jgi:hypothetical protein
MRSAFISRFLAPLLVVGSAITPAFPGRAAFAADHGDAPNVAHDQGSDIADVFMCLDPNDNSRVVIAVTIRGFIASGENVNFGFFDPALRYRFQIENTGDSKPDGFLDVTFSPRLTTSDPQIATVKLPNGNTFTAETTKPSLSATAPAFVVTDNAENSAKFFAGMVDDPFFFDIPAFIRFTASVRSGAPDATLLQRGRDSFAGYNIMAIAISVPATSLQPKKGPPSTSLGVNFLAQRSGQSVAPSGEVKRSGGYKTIDRMGLPAINVALIPFNKKSLYNVSSTLDDANAKFAPDIIASLTSLGTSLDNITALAELAVNRGDILRLNLGIPNTGPGGGTNPEAAFPNGRRLNDDTIDTILTVVANGSPLGDNVNNNGGGTTNTFPFFSPPNQPKANGVTDDGTRN